MNVLLKHRKKQADDVQTFTEKETPSWSNSRALKFDSDHPFTWRVKLFFTGPNKIFFGPIIGGLWKIAVKLRSGDLKENFIIFKL